MGLHAIVDTVPEGLEDHYAEGNDGRFYLVVDGIEEHPSVLGLKTKRDDLLARQRTLKAEVAKFEGVDAEKARAAIQKLADLERQELVAKGDIDALQSRYEKELASVRDQAAIEIKKAEEETDAEKTAARDFFRGAKVTAAVAAAKGQPELLNHNINPLTKVERGGDGEFSLVVLDPNGTPRIKDSQGSPFTLDDLVAEFKANPKYNRAFDGTGASGGGASASGSGGRSAGTPKTISPDELWKYTKEVQSGEVKVDYSQ